MRLRRRERRGEGARPAFSYCSNTGQQGWWPWTTDPDLCPACGNVVRDHAVFSYVKPPAPGGV